MSHAVDLTVMILTYNEEPNIDRVLAKLTWAPKVLVVDSFSTDRTLEIVATYDNAEVIQRPFDTFAGQCNFGLSKINTEWVLSLDADYILSDDLVKKIPSLLATSEADGFHITLKYCVFGKALRGTILPPRTVLYRKAKATYFDDGHAHRVKVEGRVINEQGPVFHDDRKHFNRWLASQGKYLGIEAEKITNTPNAQLSISDKIRKLIIFSPLLVFVYSLILKGGLLDGWRGWYYAFQWVIAELILSARLIEKRVEP